MTINFNPLGSFNGIVGGSKLLNNPTSIQFGPDGRLYVSEQNGTINAFTVELQNGEYVATANEELMLPNGAEAVKSIQNHNDDGSLSGESNRQVTGIVITGTANNPILYVSSSDPRIATFNDPNLDTNSGVITRLTWTGTEWEAVDIIRGLPRSEENHSVNGMVLGPDGTKLYLAVGGNTNNGAPSNFFANTGEYALSGTVLEIDLVDLESRPILTDPAGGQNDTSRQFIYDLPTLDDPTVFNMTDGVGEDEFGIDEAGPWGGNDGFNMAILPADAPLRIFADGLRNHYDLVLTENGNFYTVDNGSNGNLGGNPLDANGNPTDQAGAGEATNTPNNGGTGDPEPLFLLEDGGYYGHPAPARSNQDLPWTVYNDSGDPDTSLLPNSVPNIADLVPDGVNIADGFIIDPSKFTNDAARLTESGIRVERDSPQSNALVTIGSSSNGLVEYTDNAFDGALEGALLVTQFNDNVTVLNLNDDGTALEPLISPGDDGILGTADDEVVDDDGVFPLISGQSNPLDVTIGPDGTIWIASFGPDNINIFEPGNGPTSDDDDFDDDGILDVDDPFIRDDTNGGSVFVSPAQKLLWDFDANQDNNLPGPDGYGGGLTGVMINGVTDFEEFFQEPSDLPGQDIKLDNVKFITAAGGGTTVIESVSNGNPLTSPNDGEYLFHTGVSLMPTVETFNIKWSIFNPADAFTGTFQQIGGYIGTGDQSNYLKIVAIQSPNGEIQVLLEDNDIVQSELFIQANDLFNVPPDQQIFFELEIDPAAATATPTITYETGDDNTTTVTGSSLDLSGTAVLDAILGNNTVNGQDSGLAVGLLSSNTGEPEANTFQAVFNDIEITATGDVPNVIYRVNAGGPEIAAIDDEIDWSADTSGNNSPFLSNPGSNNTASFSAVEPGATVPGTTPGAIFDTERWDNPSAPEMQWAFDVPNPGVYEVRLYLGNGFNGTNDPGERVFNVAIEGEIPSNLDAIDLSAQFGHQVGGVITNNINVTDGTLNIEFLHLIENPLINGIEILQGVTQSLTLEIDTTSISENGGIATATVTRNTETTDPLTVTLTSSDTSEAVVPLTVEIPAGEASATFDIIAVDDTVVDGTQTPTITATANGFTDGVATLDVTDDDPISMPEIVLYRVNAGGPEIAAIDGDIDWSADTSANNSPFLSESGSNNTAGFPAIEPGATVPETTPGTIFDTERWDNPSAPEMQWAFDVPQEGLYEVRLYLGNGFNGTNDPGERVFDVAIEDTVFTNLDDIDLSGQFGHLVGGVISNTLEVTDGTINIEFLHGIQNPLVNGIEIIQLDDDMPTAPTVSIIGGPYTVNESDSQVQISLLTDITVPSDETVDVTFEIVPSTATAQSDYEYQSATATFDSQTGVYTDTITIAGSSSDATILIDILQDAIAETDEAFTVNITDVSPNAQIGTSSASVTIQDDDSSSGEAVLGITLNNNNVQGSNFGNNSFEITNTGDKEIAQVDIDVTNALYPDSVFDPFGEAGDTISKQLTINTNGNTGVVAPSNDSYIGTGGTAGFEAIQLVFDESVDGGFETGETIGFSVDMDPNSIAGAQKSPLDAGSNPPWDVGGVSGAELIGSSFTVTFTDGTTATGELQGNNNQAGSQALASQASSDLSVSLTVNNLGAGGVGTYDETGPSVIVSGPAGQTARVVLTKGFIQPTSLDPFINGTPAQQEFAPILQAQLDALAASDFPANNAVEFQTVDVLLTGGDQDISGLFDFSSVANFDFAGEDQVPLGFVASVIDPTNDDLPLGPVSQPIYLEFEDETSGSNPIRLEAEDAGTIVNYRTENISVASESQVLSFLGGSANEQGNAIFGFNEAPGAYDIIVGTFDENDGQAQFVVELNDVETGLTTEIGSLDLNIDLGSNLANAQTFISPTVAMGVELTPGDSITVNGFENGNEHARLDYIELVPSSV